MSRRRPGLRKHHLAQGQRQHPDDRSAIYRSRAELARTREVLEAAPRQSLVVIVIVSDWRLMAPTMRVPPHI